MTTRISLPNRPALVYLLLALIFGTTYVFLTPPFQVPDEGDHFMKAYDLSELRFLPVHGEKGYGQRLPTSLIKTVVPYTAVCLNPEARLPPGRLANVLKIPLSPEDRHFAIMCNAATFPPVPYLPAATAIGIGRAFSLPPVALMYAGRFATMLTSVLLIAFAIWIMPVHRWVMLLLGLMPMTLFILASLSADALTIAISFCFIAVILREVYVRREPITARDIAVFTILGALLTLSKLLYFPLVLLTALIPASRFEKRARRLAAVFIPAAVALVIVLAWSSLVPDIVEVINRTLGRPIDAAAQKHFILAHPLVYVYVLANTFAQEWRLYLESFVGILGWLDVTLPPMIIWAFWIVLIVTALSDSRDDTPVPALHRGLFVAVTGISILLLVTSFYVIWTAPENATVEGFRGRYLIPAAPLILLLLYNRRFPSRRIQPVFGLVLPAFAAIVLGATIPVIHARYYVPDGGRFSLGLTARENIFITGGIVRTNHFRQTFESPWPGLRGVRVLLCTFGTDPVVTPYRLELREGDSDEPVRVVPLDPARIRNWEWVDVEFDPIPDSAGRTYRFTITPEQAEIRTPITVQFSGRGLYPEGDTMIEGVPSSRDVVFELLYGTP